MGIGLVAYIPDDLIFRGIQAEMQGDGQLYRSQA